MADLESPDPTPEPAAPEPAAPAAPEPPPDPLEASTVEMQGGKYVPLSAVLAEREKAKTYKDKAEAYDQTAQYVNQVRPYIDFLQAHPDLMTRTQQQTQPTPTTTTQPVDEDATDLARTLDLYTASGEPDVVRAQKLMKVVDKAADKKAEDKMKPLVESTTRERSAHNYQRALATKTQDGRSADPNALNALWARVDPNISATEEGATAVVMLALGMGSYVGQTAPPQPITTPPVVTERAGSRTPNAPSMSALDEKMAEMRGRSHDEWSKLTRGFTPGRPNVLED